MNLIFAHHDMLSALDVLHIHPVTAMDHVVAFLVYALVASGAFFTVLVVSRLPRVRSSWAWMSGTLGRGWVGRGEGSL